MGHISDSLLTIELRALKSCMKQSTSSNRPNIVSVVKDRQCSFMKKYLLLKEDDAIAKQIWTNYALDNGLKDSKVYIAYIL